MLYKLAWRNIWRNKGRTFITMAMIFVAVILSSLMMSVKEGTYETMMDSMVGSFTGYAQVHLDGYWEDKSLDDALEFTPELQQKLDDYNGIEGYLPRLESFGLASANDLTKGVMVVGFDPEREASLAEQVKQGSLVSPNDQQVLLGKDLAKSLKLDVGDTIVIIGQGYRGASAAGKYAVSGLISFGSPEISKKIVFLPMKEAQYYLNAPDMATAIILKIDNRDDALKVSKELGEILGEKYEVMDWNTLVPEVQRMINGDKVEGYVFMLILYMVISFGIFGTILMMLSERKHEFGVLVALGMKKIMLGFMVFLEISFMSLLGALVGIVGAFPICATMHYNPIELGGDYAKQMEEYGMQPVIQASLDPGIWITQAIIVYIIAIIMAIYAIIKISRINEIDAMRS